MACSLGRRSLDEHREAVGRDVDWEEASVSSFGENKDRGGEAGYNFNRSMEKKESWKEESSLLSSCSRNGTKENAVGIGL